jgi:hypothetical protein
MFTSMRYAHAPAVLLAISMCRPTTTPRVGSSVADRWLFLDEPLKAAINIGDAWDGISTRTKCATGQTTIDTTGTQVVDIGSDSSNYGLGFRIARLFHIDGSLRKARTWSIHASGARVATGQDIAPDFSDSCQPKRRGVPRYPLVVGLLGYDSLSMTLSDSAGRAFALDSLALKKLDSLGLHGATGGGRSIVTRTGGVWVAMHLMGVTPARISECVLDLAQGVTAQCPDRDAYPFLVSARRLTSGDYELTTQATGLGGIRRDTVATGFQQAFGIPDTAKGTIGEWFAMRPETAPDGRRVTLTISRHDYNVTHFRSEADRDAFDKFVR